MAEGTIVCPTNFSFKFLLKETIYQNTGILAVSEGSVTFEIRESEYRGG